MNGSIIIFFFMSLNVAYTAGQDCQNGTGAVEDRKQTNKEKGREKRRGDLGNPFNMPLKPIRRGKTAEREQNPWTHNPVFEVLDPTRATVGSLRFSSSIPLWTI